jgi:glucan biosynthesis protein C
MLQKSVQRLRKTADSLCHHDKLIKRKIRPWWTENSMEQSRLHALDAIRGIALLLGLFLHGSISFWPGLDSFGFPISDNSKSMTLTYMFYVLHMFRMAVFFLIAGFFAHLSLSRKGYCEFLKDRLKRIALPMISAWIISLVLIIPIALWAARKLFGPDSLAVLQNMQQSTPAQPVLLQFWFLYYLLWFYGLATLFSFLLTRLNPDDQLIGFLTRLIYRLCKFRVIVIFTACISAWFFYTRENWLFWVGIPTPTEAVWKEAPAFFIYGMAFLLGWLFDRQRQCLEILKAHWPQYFVLALALTFLSVSHLTYPVLVYVDVSDREKLTFALIYAFASWCWIFSLIGIGMQFFSKKSEWRRYIADASYWIYIAHLPVILFLQTLLMQVPWHWSVKFGLILGITTALLFWSYEKVIRYSFIGTALNGPRQRKTDSAEKTQSV